MITPGSNKIFDLVIENGTVADVRSQAFHSHNIGIIDGKIAYVGPEPLLSRQSIDAHGLIVSPGFIDFHSHVDANTFSGECLVRQGGTTTLGGERHMSSSMSKSIADGFIVNQGFSISQSFTLRKAAGVNNPNRPATREEINVMVALANRFMEYGAYSINFALELIPGTSFDEILAMAKVAKSYDRPITIHMRKDGWEALQCFEEILQVARLTHVKVQILQLMYMVGIGGAMPKALEILDSARAEGLDITADSGVYDAYCASIGTGIFDKGWEAGYGNFSINDLIISSGIHSGEHCTHALFDTLRRDFPQTLVTAYVCDAEAIPEALSKDYVFVSTNAADGPHYPGIGAPEVTGTFPRLLGRYVREEKALTLMEALRKITILPAERFGLDRIGVLEVGKNADITIFDAKTIADRSDFIGRGQPDIPPDGISYVIVNGDLVVDHGQLTENRRSGQISAKL